MGDLKLFKIEKKDVKEIHGDSVQLEKSLQTLIEQNLENLLGVKFLDSEYSTGKKHGGRIDTIGIFDLIKLTCNVRETICSISNQ